MNGNDSPTESDVTSTQYDTESGDSASSDEQTTASERNESERSSEEARVNGLMKVVGKKETEKQAALAERDAAINQRDEAASALAALQAEYDTYLQGYVEPEDEAQVSASQPVADPEPPPAESYISPVLRERNGHAPANPIAQPRPRMSEAEAALRGMEQVYADHMRGVN